jgi:phosphatidylserine/phosphatidylglycerophosphate/cardiolipin synthase-like enzyme
MRAMWIAFALGTACGQTSGADFERAAGAEDELAGVTEDSPLAAGLLRFLNGADEAALTRAGGPALSIRSASALLTYRSGGDGAIGTADDRVFWSLSGVLGVPGVTRRQLKRLVAYERTQPHADSACDALSPRTFPQQLQIAPEDGSDALLHALAAAQRSIDVTIYQLSSRPVIAGLAEAAARGLHVRVILDRTQNGAAALMMELGAAGISARPSSAGFRFTHQKTVILDRTSAWISTGNLDDRSLGSARNLSVIDRDFEDVLDLSAIFEADWTEDPVDLGCTRLVVSPENARARVMALIASAEQTLDIEALYITSTDVTRTLSSALQRGVRVRVLFNDPRFGVGDATREARALVGAGAQVRRLPNRFVHAKTILADGRRLFVGSENFSETSLDENREVGLVLTSEPEVARASDTFDRDWSSAVSFF